MLLYEQSAVFKGEGLTCDFLCLWAHDAALRESYTAISACQFHVGDLPCHATLSRCSGLAELQLLAGSQVRRSQRPGFI